MDRRAWSLRRTGLRNPCDQRYLQVRPIDPCQEVLANQGRVPAVEEHGVRVRTHPDNHVMMAKHIFHRMRSAHVLQTGVWTSGCPVAKDSNGPITHFPKQVDHAWTYRLLAIRRERTSEVKQPVIVGLDCRAERSGAGR